MWLIVYSLHLGKNVSKFLRHLEFVFPPSILNSQLQSTDTPVFVISISRNEITSLLPFFAAGPTG